METDNVETLKFVMTRPSRSSLASHARTANYILLAVFFLAWAPTMVLNKGGISSRRTLSLILFLVVEIVQTGLLCV